MPDTTLNAQTMVSLDQAQAAQAARNPLTKRPATEAQMQKTAQDFEAMVLSQMLKPMFEGVETEEPFGGGQAEKMWQSVMIDEMAKEIARGPGVGIADSVQREMLKMQEMR